MNKIVGQIARKVYVFVTMVVLLLISSSQLVCAADNSGDRPDNPVISNNGVTTWDCVYFGNFWQNDTNWDGIANEEDEKEQIKWRVLSVDGDDAFVIADHVLYQLNDGVDYEDAKEWKENIIRTWLNEDFLAEAFTQAEKQAIIRQNILESTDYLYLPCKAEMTNPKYGFSASAEVEDVRRRTRVTEYAADSGPYPGIGSAAVEGEEQCYYLRDFSKDYDDGGTVCLDEICSAGNYRTGLAWVWGLGVRPVMHIDLSKKGWSMADSYSSTDEPQKQYNDWKYYVMDNKAIICGYKGSANNVVVPNTVDNYPVTKVESMEGGSRIKKISFSDNVLKVGYIGNDLPNLEEVQWEKGIRVIGSGSFSNCKYLKTMELPETVTVIGGGAFHGSGITQLKIPERVKRLDEYVFEDCYNLTSITLPEGLVSIGDNAFYSCGKLEEIYIPSTVEKIGCDCFNDCNKLKSVIFEKNIQQETQLKQIGEGAFEDCTALKTIRLPYGLDKIESSMFRACHGMQGVIDIPDSVSKIEEKAFYNCYNLQAVVLPANIQQIEQDAFEGTSYDFYLVVKEGTNAEKWVMQTKQPYAYSVGGVIYNKREVVDDDDDEDDEEDSGNNSVIPVIPGQIQNGNVQSTPNTQPTTFDKATTQENISMAAGDHITIGKLDYKVTDNSQGQHKVEFSGAVSKKVTNITIPATVAINGVSYKVTGISNNALKNCKKLKKISIKSKTLAQKFFSKKVFKKLGNKVTVVVPKSCKKKYSKWLRKAGFRGKVRG